MSDLLYVGFTSNNTHVQASDTICFPAILEGVKGSIDMFRDAFRLYRVMGLSNGLHEQIRYGISGVGDVVVHILYDENTDIMFDFSDTVVMDIVQSDDFKLKLTYSGLSSVTYSQCINDIVNVINNSLQHIYVHFIDTIFSSWGKTQFNGIGVAIVGRVGVDSFLEGKLHTEYGNNVGMRFKCYTILDYTTISGLDIYPKLFRHREIYTIDGVLDMLEMMAFFRNSLQSHTMYKYIQYYGGNIEEIDYFDGRESVGDIVLLGKHSIDVDYYTKIELNSTTSASVSYGNNTFRGKRTDCEIDFFVSSNAFMRKTMGSAFFDINRLEAILYDSMYAFGQYVGCWE